MPGMLVLLGITCKTKEALYWLGLIWLKRQTLNTPKTLWCSIFTSKQEVELCPVHTAKYHFPSLFLCAKQNNFNFVPTKNSTKSTNLFLPKQEGYFGRIWCHLRSFPSYGAASCACTTNVLRFDWHYCAPEIRTSSRRGGKKKKKSIVPPHL